MDAAVEIVFRIDQVCFRLANLRSGLRFRGVGGEEFAFKIAEVALRLLKVGPLSRPSCGQAVNCSTRFFAKSIRGVRASFLFAALLS